MFFEMEVIIKTICLAILMIFINQLNSTLNNIYATIPFLNIKDIEFDHSLINSISSSPNSYSYIFSQFNNSFTTSPRFAPLQQPIFSFPPPPTFNPLPPPPPPPTFNQPTIPPPPPTFNQKQNFIKSINPSIYNKISSDIGNLHNYLFRTIHGICTIPFPKFCHGYDENSFNEYDSLGFNNINDLTKNVAINLNNYKNNPNINYENEFIQSNLQLQNCLFNVNNVTQAQTLSLPLDEKTWGFFRNIFSSLNLDVVQEIMNDFVQIGSINEQLGTKNDIVNYKCF